MADRVNRIPVYTVVYPRVCAVNTGPRADQACLGFAQLLASMPDVGCDSDFERLRTSAEVVMLVIDLSKKPRP
jgi:hypothetical protein